MGYYAWLWGGITVLMLIAVLLMLIMGWAWLLPRMVHGMGSAAAGLWTSWRCPMLDLPVPNEEDEDYLETRSCA